MVDFDHFVSHIAHAGSGFFWVILCQHSFVYIYFFVFFSFLLFLLWNHCMFVSPYCPTVLTFLQRSFQGYPDYLFSHVFTLRL